jgi:hypothetical protein
VESFRRLMMSGFMCSMPHSGGLFQRRGPRRTTMFTTLMLLAMLFVPDRWGRRFAVRTRWLLAAIVSYDAQLCVIICIPPRIFDRSLTL